MNYEASIDLIKTCLCTGGTEQVEFASIDRLTNITIRDGFRYETLRSYSLNIDSIRVLASHEYSSKQDWDGDLAAYVIFKFDKGLGVAYKTGWWGPTFNDEEYDIDIQEDFDWKKFFEFVLTESLRKKLALVGEQMDSDMAELILLTKECD